MPAMSSSSTSSVNTPAASADQRFIDKQMAGVIEAIMIQSYSLSNKGFIPSGPQLAAYIAGLDSDTVLSKIRKHPGAAATRALQADDAELMRWARLVGLMDREPQRR